MSDLVPMPDNPDDEIPSDTDARLAAIEQTLAAHTQTLDALRVGVNTIGEMMNGVADAFGQIMAQVQQGGLGAILGNVMGGKKNG